MIYPYNWIVLMKKLFCLVSLTVILLTGCGFHLQHETEIPKQFQTMTFHSNNPYGSLSRTIKDLLTKNKVELVSQDPNNNYPSLRILNNNISKETISIYQNGKSAEYQLILTLNAQVIIAGNDIYPITTKVFRTFFDNPANALAKNTEQNLIEQEMYTQAAKQLISKLKSINSLEHKLSKP